MPVFLDQSKASFAAEFAALLTQKREAAVDVAGAVAKIVADVVARGDDALFELTRRFDRFELTPANLRVGADEIAAAKKSVPAPALKALHFAAERIGAFHQRQLPTNDLYTDQTGTTLGLRTRPDRSYCQTFASAHS